ncbi:FG-GAP repeat containing protein [Sedimentisphaera cyanobacteriorum]|uniref:FG-GAP repeat containing protein n=1 Tax=Sedimentisphaera cyanobacteriorum TaxID=1940790 RepID=A0A1Q2HNL5_9BACT|nr:FG-GAP-like repeat-containing protein [Sedimentisphaera cyanobacteriorum]AQQ09099.1 FG-GAP repeat containing protein [Sedimentisphaera cyanobacteriorum]
MKIFRNLLYTNFIFFAIVSSVLGNPLNEAFSRIDKDNDKTLSKSEINRFPQLRQRLEGADTNENGRLTREEFAAFVRRSYEKQQTSTFDGDGKITPDESRNRRWKQRRRIRQPATMNGALPESSANVETIFRPAYIHKGSLAQASALVDVFGNGHPDILIACKRQVHLVKNNSTGSFTHAKTYVVDNANGWGLHDFNLDGQLDAFVAQQQREQDDAWINNSEGTFQRRDLGNESLGNARSILFADFDGDGSTDAFHSVSSFQTNHAGCQLHPGKTDGTFAPDIIRQVLAPDVPGFWYDSVTHTERGKEQWGNKMIKGSIVRDFDGDDKPDLIMAAYADRGFQEGGRGGIGQQWIDQQERGLFVLHNRSQPGKIRFAEVAKKAVGSWAYGNTNKDWNCYSVIPLDYNRDGRLDLFVGAVTRRAGLGRFEDTRSVALLENVSKPGEIRFIDRTEDSGFGHYNEMYPAERWQISFASGAAFDYDNDGWVDMCLVNRRDKDKTRWPYPHLFQNRGKGTFVSVPPHEHGIGGGAGEVYRGSYDPRRPGGIRWESTPEYANPDFDDGPFKRCQGFAVANGRLYASVSPRLLVRRDGTEPKWTEVFRWKPEQRAGAGLRGITAVAAPDGTHEVILGSREQEGRILRIDPEVGYKVTDELDSQQFLKEKLGSFRGGRLVAYNRFIPGTHPGTGKPIHLVTVAGIKPNDIRAA